MPHCTRARQRHKAGRPGSAQQEPRAASPCLCSSLTQPWARGPAMVQPPPRPQRPCCLHRRATQPPPAPAVPGRGAGAGAPLDRTLGHGRPQDHEARAAEQGRGGQTECAAAWRQVVGGRLLSGAGSARPGLSVAARRRRASQPARDTPPPNSRLHLHRHQLLQQHLQSGARLGAAGRRARAQQGSVHDIRRCFTLRQRQQRRQRRLRGTDGGGVTSERRWSYWRAVAVASAAQAAPKLQPSHASNNPPAPAAGMQ